MLMSKRWFRFGLPLGSATIVAALLDTTIGAYWLLNDVGSSLFLYWWHHSKPIDTDSIVNVALISTRLGLAISLWIFVLLKQRLVLIFWIPLSVITDILIVGYAILKQPRDFVADELWICNIFFLFLFRLYINSVVFQTLTRLLRNARLKLRPASNYLDGLPNGGIEDHGQEDYESDSKPTSVKYYLVEPIGRNPCRIWRYFSHIPRLGAAVLVVFEISWTLFVLSTHLLTEFLFGGRIFFLHDEEEIIMRIWRILINFVAIIFILKKKKTLLRFWLIIYFWTMFISIALTIWTVVEWTFETPTVVVLVICFIGISDVILRFGVMYFCLMLSLQSQLSVSRTQSLKSETRSLRPIASTVSNATIQKISRENRNLVSVSETGN